MLSTVDPTVDPIIGPRRGGMRFVEPSRAAWARSSQDNIGRTAQIAADALVELLRIAAGPDPGHVYGGTRHAVRVIETEKSPGRDWPPDTAGRARDASRRRAARKQPFPQSLETVERTSATPAKPTSPMGCSSATRTSCCCCCSTTSTGRSHADARSTCCELWHPLTWRRRQWPCPTGNILQSVKLPKNRYF